MWAELKPVFILMTIVVIGGTLLAAPLLRLLGWADTKTSFKDALNVQLAAAPLLGAFAWRVRTYSENSRLLEGLIRDTDFKFFTALIVITSVVMFIGYPLLGRR
jgi:hypothetical protein